MSEIKFACPHCRQHIACDSDYVSLDIACPSCGGTMVVPRLKHVASMHPEVVLVASTPSPQRSPAPQVPPLVAWTDEQWQRNYDEVTGESTNQSPPWLVAAIGTIILAAVLKANGFGGWLIILCLLAGCVASGILAARNKGDRENAGYQIMRVLTYVCFAIVILPVIGLGILFLGCTVCH